MVLFPLDGAFNLHEGSAGKGLLDRPPRVELLQLSRLLYEYVLVFLAKGRLFADPSRREAAALLLAHVRIGYEEAVLLWAWCSSCKVVLFFLRYVSQHFHLMELVV